MPVAVAVLAGLNKLTGGATKVFVSGAPWTEVFWSTLFYLMLAGVEGLAMAVRLAPAAGRHCGDPYARLFACGTHYALTSGIPSAVCDGLRLSR